MVPLLFFKTLSSPLAFVAWYRKFVPKNVQGEIPAHEAESLEWMGKHAKNMRKNAKKILDELGPIHATGLCATFDGSAVDFGQEVIDELVQWAHKVTSGIVRGAVHQPDLIHDLVHDISHDSLVNFLKAIPEVKLQSPKEGWGFFKTIIVNGYKNRMRTLGRAGESSGGPLLNLTLEDDQGHAEEYIPDDLPEPETLAIQKQRREVIQTAIKTYLYGRQRETDREKEVETCETCQEQWYEILAGRQPLVSDALFYPMMESLNPD